MIDLSNIKNFAPFDGDGRKRMQATESTKKPWPKCTFQTVSNAASRRIIEQFNSNGRYDHGPVGADLWVILVWCATMDIDMKAAKHPLGGWYSIWADWETPSNEPAATPVQQALYKMDLKDTQREREERELEEQAFRDQYGLADDVDVRAWMMQ